MFLDSWVYDVESGAGILAEVLKKKNNTETPKPETHISTTPFMSNLTITGYCHQIEPVWIPIFQFTNFVILGKNS